MQALNNDFLRYWCYQLKTYDCDPSLYLMNYLFNRYEFNLEQKYWLCWIYANTYHLPTAWVIWNEFPDFAHVGIERLTRFQGDNYTRLPYQKDQKWLRGKLPETFAAYRAAVEPHGSQLAFWDAVAPDDSFSPAWQTILGKTFPRFGRYTAWFYLQSLNECCGHDFVPPSMFFSDPSCKQPREGACLAVLPKFNRPPTDAELESWCDDQIILAHGILAEELETLPVSPDRFSLETSLCAWSKMPRGAPKGRYLGYYLDRMAEDIIKTSEQEWPGIEWDALWDGRREILLPELNQDKVNPWMMDTYPTSGSYTVDVDLLYRLDQWYDTQCAKSYNFLL